MLSWVAILVDVSVFGMSAYVYGYSVNRLYDCNTFLDSFLSMLSCLLNGHVMHPTTEHMILRFSFEA